MKDNLCDPPAEVFGLRGADVESPLMSMVFLYFWKGKGDAAIYDWDANGCVRQP